MDISSINVAFIGTGQMATALAVGFVRSLLRADQISGCDPSEIARQNFASAVGKGCRVTADAASAVAKANVIILAVKPQIMTEALQTVSATLDRASLVISVAAGITLQKLAASLPDGARIIRVMPNTPCLIGKGASGLAVGRHATAEDQDLAIQLLETVGLVETVPEHLLDAVTGLSGSGPAYVFQLIEALSDGGVKMGLPRATALRLASQTVAGAAEMQLSTGHHPAVLKDSVTSPGGTTIAGLHALENGGMRAALINAVEAATLRSRQLGQQ